ncbi:MAG: pentapeptide repeat-containing protein [Burkholderiaceae bacterium]|nr:pentapeptide repeat-containing protein [Burkholderiaceae bacterium]
MDTNSNIPTKKKVVSVEILHLDEKGYGPTRELTRREWRTECLKYLLAGRDSFKDWQTQCKEKINGDIYSARYECRLTFSDGSHETVLNHLGFTYSLDFVGHIFDADQYMNFGGYEFIVPALFVGAQFHALLNFRSIVFGAYINCSNASFKDDVYFSESIFNAYADFTSAEFAGQADFSSIIFKGDVYFSSVVFNKAAYFTQTIFEKQCRFDSVFNVQNTGWENGTHFKDEANFENAIFKNVGHFERVRFSKFNPSYLGVDTSLTRLEFSDDSFFAKNDQTIEAVNRLGHLKRLSDEHGQIDQALNFNALELHLKYRRSKTDKVYKVVTWLYEKLSDYGRSFTKPIFWYGILICLSSILVMAYSTYYGNPAKDRQALCKQMEGQPPPLKLSYERAVFEYAMFRAGGLMDFTDTGKQNNAVNCRLFDEPIEPPLIRAWGVFKGIASIALLFLAALGLRNKYRIK